MPDRWTGADPYMRQVRVEVFDSPEPPFDDALEAYGWLERESEKGAVPFSDRETWDAYRSATMEAIRNLKVAAELGPASRKLSIVDETLFIYFPAEHNNQISDSNQIEATTLQLMRLAEAAQVIAEYIPCFQDQATFALLLGSELTMTSDGPDEVTVKEDGGKFANEIGRLPRSTSIEVAGNPERGVKSLLRAGILSDGLTMQQRTMCDLVASLRDQIGPPKEGRPGKSEGVREYWTRVMEEWNKIQRHQYHDWTGPKKLYQRAKAAQKRAKKHRVRRPR